MLASAAGGGRGQPSRDQLSAALESAEDLIAVLNATLDTEVAEAGELLLARLPFDPARLARDVILLHRPQAAAKNIELSVHIDEQLVRDGAGGVVGDAVRTRQILSSLVGVKLSGGSFIFSFTNATGLSFSVLATNNAVAPKTNWPVVGHPIESPAGSGKYQFTNSPATNPPQFFILSQP